MIGDPTSGKNLCLRRVQRHVLVGIISRSTVEALLAQLDSAAALAAGDAWTPFGQSLAGFGHDRQTPRAQGGATPLDTGAGTGSAELFGNSPTAFFQGGIPEHEVRVLGL